VNAPDAAAIRFSKQRADVRELTKGAQGASWSEYEALKAQWRERNPDATPQEYGAAMRYMTTRLGL
jgi:hypothetical protein